MHLDIPTLAVVTVFVTALLGALLLFAGVRNHAARALSLWGVSFLVGAFGLALVIARGHVPDWLSIECANALVLAGMSLLWSGARLFDGRGIGLPHVAAVPSLWLAACLVPAIGGDINHRTIVASALAASLSLLTAREIGRGRAEPLLSRWPTIVTLVGYAAAMLARIPATLLVPQAPSSNDFLASALFPVLAFGTLMFTVILAFLLLNMSKERTERRHKLASMIDPLSGVANRRAFLDGAERAIRRHGSRSPLAVMLFDLDHFKSINDGKGHAAGDAVIRMFAGEASRALGPDALFGRIGGEEFGALIPVRDDHEAVAIAHHVRRSFTAAAEHCVLGLRPTVSIGVALAADPGASLDGLLAAADRALYRAKAKGRNRVEYADVAAAVLDAGDPVAGAAGETAPGEDRVWRRAAGG